VKFGLLQALETVNLAGAKFSLQRERTPSCDATNIQLTCKGNFSAIQPGSKPAISGYAYA
jgi:hypothetical protein